jgi:hypothetical protein
MKVKRKKKMMGRSTTEQQQMGNFVYQIAKCYKIIIIKSEQNESRE